MTYTILFSPFAQQQLDKLEKNVQERVLSTLERIRVRPYEFVKKLTGYPYYRLRVGDYRVIYRIEDKKVKIFIIQHRSIVYTNSEKRTKVI